MPTISFKPLTPPAPGAACSGIVPHRAFRQARAALLEAADRGAATLALLGEAGTGKTLLLRHLGGKLRERGHVVTLLRQGDLPWQIVPGTVLLIDEASRLDPQALAALTAQDQTLVVFADLPKFGEVLEQQVLPARIVRLPPLEPAEVPGYIAAWLQLSGRNADTVSADGMARLALHSGGTPRLIARLLNAAFALGAGAGRVTGAEIDEVALLRLNGLGAEPVETQSAPPRREAIEAEISAAPLQYGLPALALVAPARRGGSGRRIAAAAITTTALAAAVVFALRHETFRPDRPAEAASVPVPKLASASVVGLASIAAPAQAAAPAPEAADRAAPSLARSAPPLLASAPSAPSISAAPALLALLAPPTLQPAPMPPLAASSETPHVLALSTPRKAALAGIEAAEAASTSENPRPGLVLLARRGDTLRALYVDLYRGVQPPPYDEVAAANPRPVRPGSVVVFPAPLGGWTQP